MDSLRIYTHTYIKVLLFPKTSKSRTYSAEIWYVRDKNYRILKNDDKYSFGTFRLSQKFENNLSELFKTTLTKRQQVIHSQAVIT